MLWRALIAFLALPGVFAFLLPLCLAGALRRPLVPGLAAIAFVLAGCAGLLWCVASFYVSGRGTLAPWSPPRHLVTQGLYRYSRNPMYVSVLVLVSGWALLFHSALLAGYALVLGLGFQLRIVLGEEPWLERTFGESWHRYAGDVHRWLGRARPRPADDLEPSGPGEA